MLNQEMKRFRASAPQVACIRSSLFPVLAFFRCGCKCPFPIATEPKVPCSKPCRCSRTNEAEVGKGVSRKAECPFLLPCPKAKEKRFGLGGSMPPKSGDVASSGLSGTKTRFRFAFHEDGGGEVSQVTAKPGLVTGMDPGGLEGLAPFQ